MFTVEQFRALSSRPVRLCCIALLCVLLAAACNLQFPSQAGNPQGGAFGAGAPGVADAAAEAQAVARDVEEADIVKVDGGKLYALNRAKGLLIIDVNDPDNPVLLGSLDLRGRGVEMYVVGQRVYVVLSADYVYATNVGDPSGGGGGGMAVGAPGTTVSSTVLPGPPVPAPDFEGSQVAIIDVANPAVPHTLGKINLAGFANDSRRVGNIIYVVGANGFPYYFRGEDDVQHDEGFVASIDVTDPNNVLPVERETFDGDSLAVHVSDQLILAASQEYDSNSGGTNTRVQAIDISDPTGLIDLRGTVDVPGIIRNRFFMDDYQDVFRIITQSNGFGFTQVKLFTYDLTDLDNITPIGMVLINQGESLEAARFDGPRGYAVTFMRVDPLFVLDIHDPANPTVSGELTVPGYSTHMEPRGDRLIAVGVDDTDGFRPVVAYYNVADPANPSELGRVVLGPPGSYTESDATYDEKAFKIVDDLGLIAIPFHHVEYPASPGGPVVPVAQGEGGSSGSPSEPKCVSGVQIVDFSDTALTQRGFFEHKGSAERVGVLGVRLFALSQAAFQTVDITDRDHPVKVGELKFFTDAESPWYNDCGYYYIDLPVDSLPGGFGPLLQLLNQLCGTGVATPLMACMAALFVAKTRRRRT